MSKENRLEDKDKALHIADVIASKVIKKYLAEIVAKFRLSDFIKSVCEDEELQPIECEKYGSCKNCPHYKPVK